MELSRRPWYRCTWKIESDRSSSSKFSRGIQVEVLYQFLALRALPAKITALYGLLYGALSAKSTGDEYLVRGRLSSRDRGVRHASWCTSARARVPRGTGGAVRRPTGRKVFVLYLGTIFFFSFFFRDRRTHLRWQLIADHNERPSTARSDSSVRCRSKLPRRD